MCFMPWHMYIMTIYAMTHVYYDNIGHDTCIFCHDTCILWQFMPWHMYIMTIYAMTHVYFDNICHDACIFCHETCIFCHDTCIFCHDTCILWPNMPWHLYILPWHLYIMTIYAMTHVYYAMTCVYYDNICHDTCILCWDTCILWQYMPWHMYFVPTYKLNHFHNGTCFTSSVFGQLSWGSTELTKTFSSKPSGNLATQIHPRTAKIGFTLWDLSCPLGIWPKSPLHYKFHWYFMIFHWYIKGEWCYVWTLLAYYLPVKFSGNL